MRKTRMHPAPDILQHLLELRVLGVDDLSAARYVMSSAFSTNAKEFYRDGEIAAYIEYLRSPLYADLLLGNRCYAAWVGSEMVGVGAWSAGEKDSPSARILTVFVRPLFVGEGIASRLIEFLEHDARTAGYRAMEASVTLNAVDLFERNGYLEVRMDGLRLPGAGEIPVVHMRKTASGERNQLVH